MIVVTAPTGNIGRVVVQSLLSAGQAVRVIARDPNQAASDRPRWSGGRPRLARRRRRG